MIDKIPNLPPPSPQKPNLPKQTGSAKKNRTFFTGIGNPHMKGMKLSSVQQQALWANIVMQTNSMMQNVMRRQKIAQENIRKSIEGEY